MHAIGIGSLARESGVLIDTIRHYERIGLLALSAGRSVEQVKRRAEDCPILNALAGETP